MHNNHKYKRVFKSHSNFFNVKQSKYPPPLEGYIEIYRNAKNKNDATDFFKAFISNEIKLNYKNEFIEKKLLNDDEYIDLFNLEFTNLCIKWNEEKEK